MKIYADAMEQGADMNINTAAHQEYAAHPNSRLRRRLLPVLVAGCFGSALANPLGPQVVNGQASFVNQGNVLSVTNTPGAIINWQSFSINPGEITRFIQQNPNSAVLNRIVGQDPSQILGALQSNGRVFLINPNGILFGQGAQIDVNGLVASTLNISNADFLKGRLEFKAGDKAADLKNQGTITTPAGGQVFLIAPNVENSGIITSPKGEVMLAAGHSVQLVDSLNPDLRVVVSAPENEALNLGQIVAQGGRTGIYGALVKQRGVVNANSAVVGENGKIILKASRDTLLEAGSRTTATGEGKGGEIQVLGERVGLSGDAKVDASGRQGGGTVLVGGDYQGRNPDVQNAKRTYVGKDVEIRADAYDTGDGGKVIVWGDEAARVYGAVSARGGQSAGDGGFVETSGHYLDVAGITVDTKASNGKTGKWLLDPTNIDVNASGSALLSDVDQFAENVGNSVVSPVDIAASATDVTLQATGDITFTNAVNLAAGVALTAQAGNSITVSNSIVTNGGAVTLKANDSSSGSATGSGVVNINSAIITNGGNVTIGGTGVTLSGTGSISAGAAVVDISADKLEGAIDLQNGSSITINGTNQTKQVKLKADNLSLSGTISANSLGQVTISPYSIGRQIELLDAKSGNTKLELTNADLANISSYDLTLSTTGATSVTASATPISVNNITNLYLTANGNVTISQPLTQNTNNGLISLTAGTGSEINIGAGGALTTSGANSQIYLRANNMTLGGAQGSINAGSGAVRVTPYVSTTAINIGAGAADNAAITLGLTDTELRTITTSGKLEIGNQNFSWAGDTSVVGALDLTGTTLTGAVGIQSGVSGHDVNVNDVVKVPADLSVIATNKLTVGASGELQTAGATSGITLAADRMNLQNAVGKTAALGGTIWVKPYSSGWHVDIGSLTDLAGSTLELSTSELNTFASTGVLRIGATSAGNLHLSGPLAPTGFNAGTISLESGGAVTQATSAAFITANKLAIKALGNVDLATAVDLSSVPNQVTNLAAQIGNASNQDKNFKFNNASALNVASAIDGISGISITLSATGYNSNSPDGVIALSSSGLLSQSDDATALLSGKAAYLKGSSVDFGSTTAAHKLNPIGVIAGEATAGSTATFSYKSNNSIFVSTIPDQGGVARSGISVPGPTGSGVYAIKLHSPTTGSAGIGQESGAAISTTAGLLLDTIGNVTLSATNSVAEIKSNSSSGSFAFLNSKAAGWDVSAIASSNQPIALASSSGTMNVKGNINAGTGNVILTGPSVAIDTGKNVAGATVSLVATAAEGTVSQGSGSTVTGSTALSVSANNIAFGGTMLGGTTATGGQVSISPYTAGRAVEVAGASATAGTLSITQSDLNKINPASSNINGGAFMVGSGGGALTFKGNFSSPGGMFANLYGTSIGQDGGTTVSGPIHAVTSGAIALTEPTNQISALGYSFTAGAGINVNTNVSSLSLMGSVNTATGDISITNTGGNIVLSNAQVNAIAGNMTLNSAGYISILASSADTYANALTNVFLTLNGNLSFSTSGGYKAYVASMQPATTHLTFNNTTGKVLFNGSQATATTAGNMGFYVGSGPGTGAAATLGSSLVLSGGDANNFVAATTVPVVTTPATPTVEACTSNPSLSGCSSVMPTVDACVADPAKLGCTAVLPTLSTCTSTPTTAGCSVVLPSLSTCTGTPTTTGCSVVLPSLSTCTSAPTTAGCSVVLPSLSTCTSTPTTTGCSVVLPTVDVCVADPAKSGCAAVLPTLTACTTTPTTAGCSVVLPTLSSCTSNPTQAGCMAVLPTLSACTTAPTKTGCSAVLPTVDACTTTPTQAGCSAILPTLSACTTAPTTAGCSVVLPTLSSCTSNPTQAGCTAILPTLSACTTAPTTTGCSAVLPTVDACTITPTKAGCSAVLPTLSACTTAPTTAGCMVVLPSMSACTETPTLTGCTAVLPTLNQCSVNPSREGCSVVVPTASKCVLNPNLPECQIVLPTNPTTGSGTDTGTGTPSELSSASSPLFVTVAKTTDTVVTTTTSTQASAMKMSPGSGTSSGGTGGSTSTANKTADSSSSSSSSSSDKSDDKKDEKKTTSGPEDSGAKKNEPAKKLYCN